MRSILRLIGAMTRIERIALLVLTLVLSVSFLLLLRLFYVQNTTVVPVAGGTYIEGSVGDVLPLLPWFVTGNDVNRDIISLVFAGLMRYNPATGKVEDDLATVKVSGDNRIYTATLKQGLFWHDSSSENPHRVSADDVMFTFKAIQEQGFGNPILEQNFQGVEIEKIDDRTVRFRLSKPYSFFSSNLTLGLVPKNAFEGIPIPKLNQEFGFGFHPIGAGPYSFLSLLQTDLSTEVTLSRFRRSGLPSYKIDRVVFRVFPDYTTLLSDILNLSGVRLVPRNDDGEPILPQRLHPIPYTLPQYVGIFFNLDRPIPADKNVRLGLQLATNKQEIVDVIHETHVIDTPLLEIDTGDWQYKFDALAAQGSFFESSWNVPEKVRLQRILEEREANAIGPLRSAPHTALLGTGSMLTLTGSTQGIEFPAAVNGIRVQTGITLADGTVQSLAGSWTVKIPTGTGASGSLKTGMNIVKMTNAKDDIIDSAYIRRIADNRLYALAAEESRLVTQYLRSKNLPPTDSRAITIEDLYLERGFLRTKKEDDPPHTRVNDRGQELTLTLLTSIKPEVYGEVANVIQKQWAAVGAKVTVVIPESKKDFEDRLLKRQYDVVLFGESLFDNLDSYPYWHSSQIQEQTDPSKMRMDAFNLSQYTSFEADALLARIRETNDPRSRARSLRELNTRFRLDIPAIVLYSPISVYAHDDSVRGVKLGKLSLHADRFGTFENWYVRTERQFVSGRGWATFLPWVFGLRKQ